MTSITKKDFDTHPFITPYPQITKAQVATFLKFETWICATLKRTGEAPRCIKNITAWNEQQIKEQVGLRKPLSRPLITMAITIAVAAAVLLAGSLIFSSPLLLIAAATASLFPIVATCYLSYQKIKQASVTKFCHQTVLYAKNDCVNLEEKALAHGLTHEELFKLIKYKYKVIPIDGEISNLFSRLRG